MKIEPKPRPKVQNWISRRGLRGRPIPPLYATIANGKICQICACVRGETLCKCEIRPDESYDSTRMIYSKRDESKRERERSSMQGWREIVEHDSRMHAERLFLVNHEGMRAKSRPRVRISCDPLHKQNGLPCSLIIKNYCDYNGLCFHRLENIENIDRIENSTFVNLD